MGSFLSMQRIFPTSGDYLSQASHNFFVVIDDGLETLPISSIRSRNMMVRKQARKKMGKSKAKDDIERIFFNPKVTSLFYRGLHKGVVSENGALREKLAPKMVTQ